MSDVNEPSRTFLELAGHTIQWFLDGFKHSGIGLVRHCWLMCRRLSSQHAPTPSCRASGTVTPSTMLPIARSPAHRSGCSTDRSRAFHYIHRARGMMDAGSSALVHSSNDRPWQPLSRIARRQTGQRTDIRQRHVPALTSLGKDEMGRGILKTGEPSGPRTQAPRLKSSKRPKYQRLGFTKVSPFFLCVGEAAQVLIRKIPWGPTWTTTSFRR